MATRSSTISSVIILSMEAGWRFSRSLTATRVMPVAASMTMALAKSPSRTAGAAVAWSAVSGARRVIAMIIANTPVTRAARPFPARSV